MSITAAERKSADYHAGPHGSFPVEDDGGHFAAAWHLAETGHGSDPTEILSHLRAFAEKHGIKIPGKKTMDTKKATGNDVQSLYRMAFEQSHYHGDAQARRDIVRHAVETGNQQHLPDEAHGLMHEMSVTHNHSDTPNGPDGMHEHRVIKAFSVTGVVMKSWDVGEDVHWEGWLSTTFQDKEQDVTEPEAFIGPMDEHFKRRAPVSIEHNGRMLPVGHLQKAEVYRDYKAIKSQVHPTDPAQFEYLTQQDLDDVGGNGVWVRGCANEPDGIRALKKGNVGGMSFIATATPEPLPGGRYRYTKFSNWEESTLAAYPINPKAIIAVTKAYGLDPKGKKKHAIDRN